MSRIQTLWVSIKNSVLGALCLMIPVGLMSDGFGTGILSYIGNEGWVVWCLFAWFSLMMPVIAFLGLKLIASRLRRSNRS